MSYSLKGNTEAKSYHAWRRGGDALKGWEGEGRGGGGGVGYL